MTAESGEVPDSLIIVDAISKAEAEIDSYLGVKYVVPLATAPAQVKALAVDLAIYHLYSRRSVVPPVRQQKYDGAVAFLKQVAAGQLVIVGPQGEAAHGSQRGDRRHQRHPGLHPGYPGGLVRGGRLWPTISGPR